MVTALQAVLPVASCQKLVGQTSHEFCPAAAVNLPAAQLEHDWRVPALLKVPAAQLKHWPDPAPPHAVWYWPPVQL
jgi:hypothetical protein